MNYTSEDLMVLKGAKRTESSRRRGVVQDAIRQAQMDAARHGQHDLAKLIGIAGQALPDTALTAIYEAIAADRNTARTGKPIGKPPASN